MLFFIPLHDTILKLIISIMLLLLAIALIPFFYNIIETIYVSLLCME